MSKLSDLRTLTRNVNRIWIDLTLLEEVNLAADAHMVRTILISLYWQEKALEAAAAAADGREPET